MTLIFIKYIKNVYFYDHLFDVGWGGGNELKKKFAFDFYVFLEWNKSNTFRLVNDEILILQWFSK